MTTLGVFPPLTAPNPDPAGPAQVEVQSVPTAVTRGPDGYLYVSELTGYPFPVGGSRIWRVPPWGGTPEVFRSGLTNVVDLKFDRHGNLYTLELQATGLLDQSDPRGALVRFAPGSTPPEVVVTDDLILPGGFDIARDGTIYVSTYSFFPDEGQLVRLRAAAPS